MRIAALVTLALVANTLNAAFPEQDLLRLSDNNLSNLTIVYDARDLDDKQLFQKLASEGAYSLEDGASVPAVTRLVRVPVGTRPVVRRISRESYLVNEAQLSAGNFRLNDAQRLEASDLATVSLEPKNPVRVSRVEVWRGVPVAAVTVYPFQPADADGLVENRRIEIELAFEPDDNSPQLTLPIEPAGAPFSQMTDRLLLNPPDRDEGEAQFNSIGRMLVLYPDNQAFRERGLVWVDSLAKWKRQVGFQVDLLGVDVQNVRTPDLRNLIRDDYYRNANPPISYLLIVGSDSASVEVWFPSFFQNNWIGDHYWGLMDDDDVYLPDIAVGRLEVHTFLELGGVVSRQLLYESRPFVEGGRQWFSRAIYTGEGIDAPGGDFVPSMVHLGRWIWLRLNQAGFNVIDTLYSREGDRLAAETEWALEEGRSLAISRGWLSGCYNANNQRPADTGRRNPFVISVTCLSYILQSPFFRATSPNDPRGPIASLSVKGLSNSSVNNSVVGGAVRSMFTFGEDRVGHILSFGKIQLWSDNRYELDEQTLQIISNLRLKGDPTTSVYTASPVDIEAEHLSSIPPTATGFNVYVSVDEAPLADAWVCISQPDGVHLVTQPGDDGWARFTFEDGTLATGALNLTITHRNAVPYIARVAVENGSASIALDDVVFENQDGLFANGESIPTTLTLLNSGNESLSNIQVNLTTEDDWTTFSRESFNIANLARGARARLQFDLQVDRSSAFGRTVRVDVSVSAGEYSWTHSFNYTSSGFQFDVPVVAVPDQNFRRGESARIVLRLRNRGDLRTPALLGELFSLDEPYVMVSQADARFAAMNGNGGTADADGELIVDLSLLAIPGNVAHFGLALRPEDAQDAFRDTVWFAVPISEAAPSDPFGPDEYGYICFDSFDSDWQKAPEYDWLEINPNKENPDYQGTRLDMRDIAVDLDTTITMPLPFTFRYYGREFDTLAINSNGWIAFGAEASMFVDFRNQQIPGIMGPEAQVAVFWQDLVNAGDENRGVFVHNVDSLGIFIVEWSDLQIYPQEDPDTALVEFQVILFDPAVYPTASGDGEIKMQYKTVLHLPGDRTDNLYFTTGIKNLDNTGGLEYVYWNNYAPGCRRLEDGMALLFTTERTFARGGATGRVVRFEDRQAGVPDVRVLFERFGLEATTDQNGRFQFERLPVGNDRIIFSRQGFNRLIQDVVILADSVVNITAALTHPTLGEEYPPIAKSLRPGANGTTFDYHLENSGNGPLDWTISARYINGDQTQYARIWEMNASAATDGDTRIYGIEILGDTIYATGGGSAQEIEDNYVYVINREGRVVRSFRQDSRDGSGLRDLAWDGDILYGAERAGNSDTLRLVGFSVNGETQRIIRPVIPRNSLDIPWGLAFSPERGSFFIGNSDQSIFEVNQDGQVVRMFEPRLPREVPRVRGLAWNAADMDGMHLYAIDDASEQMGMRLIKINPEDGTARIVAVLPNEEFHRGTGLCITADWVRSQLVAAGIDGGRTVRDDDFIRLFEIGPDTRYLILSEYSGSVPPAESGGFTIELRADGLSLGVYELALFIEHNAAEPSVLVPLSLTITNETTVETPGIQPLNFRLDEAFPNPFNGLTTLSFSIPEAGQVKLRVYDVTGRLVSKIVNGHLNAGSHRLYFNAGDLSAGIYLCRLQMGGKSAVQRLVLIP